MNFQIVEVDARYTSLTESQATHHTNRFEDLLRMSSPLTSLQLTGAVFILLLRVSRTTTHSSAAFVHSAERSILGVNCNKAQSSAFQ